VIAALGLSLFSKELLGLMTSKAFHGAWQVVPFMAFANVITGVERLLRAPIQFHLRGGKFVSIVTLAAAVAQGTLLFVLIPRFGFIGIGLTYVIVGSLVALTFGWIANSIEKFDWDYRAFIQLIFLGISGCAALLYLTETSQVHYGFFLKTAGFLVLSFVVLVVSTGGITEIQQNLAAIQDILSSKLKRVS
jgi:O-antigen/teichoic acid export membrane protein